MTMRSGDVGTRRLAHRVPSQYGTTAILNVCCREPERTNTYMAVALLTGMVSGLPAKTLKLWLTVASRKWSRSFLPDPLYPILQLHHFCFHAAGAISFRFQITGHEDASPHTLHPALRPRSM